MSVNTLNNGIKTISNEIGLLYHMMKLPRMNLDPSLLSFGVWPSNTEFLGGEKFGGRSSGCGYQWDNAVLSTIGETVERYAPAFYNKNELIRSSFKDLGKNAVHPSEYALFHEEQFKDKRFMIKKFDEEIELTWCPMHDLTTGETSYVPGQFIYMPYNQDKHFVTANTSTGLSAHTNFYKALLGGLYEVIERDSFVLTWMQNLVPQKIKITSQIQEHLNKCFPGNYEWNFFDITYDLETPSVFGICFGEAEYGKFVAVGTSSRGTFGEALQKVIQEVGQAVPYFRYLLGERKNWTPSDDFNELQNFEDHSILYLKRPELLTVFDKWRNAKEEKVVDLWEQKTLDDKDEIKRIVKALAKNNCNVLVKDITTPDIRQLGFYSIKVFVPQLIQMAGAYPFYFNGGERLYSVPKKLGYPSNDYSGLNKFPHPFP